MRKAVLSALMVMMLSATGTVMSAPARAQTQESSAVRAAGPVEVAYSAPEISEEGTRVTWNWDVVNKGDAPVSKVVVTHQLTPQLKVIAVSAPCEVRTRDIECKYGDLAPGQKAEGTLAADLPPDTSGDVQIQGRVTWEPAGESAPAAGR